MTADAAELTAYLDVFTALRRRNRSEGGSEGWSKQPDNPLYDRLHAEAVRVTGERNVEVYVAPRRRRVRKLDVPEVELIETAISVLGHVATYPPEKDGEWIIDVDEVTIFILLKERGRQHIGNIRGGGLNKKLSAEIQTALLAGRIAFIGKRQVDNELTTIEIPTSIVPHLLTDKFGVIVQPTRIVGTSANRHLNGFCLFVRTDQLSDWLAKRGRPISVRSRGRPRIPTTAIDPAILALIDNGAWDGRASPVRLLKELLGRMDVSISLPTVRQAVDRLQIQTGRPELLRKKNNRRLSRAI